MVTAQTDVRSHPLSRLLGLSILILIGCSFLSFAPPAPVAETQVPFQLTRCSAAPAALCLESFGLGDGQLAITFYSPAAGSSEFFLKVWQEDASTIYPCTLNETLPTTFECRGPLIDLGTAIKIDLYTKTGRVPLAEGEFTLVDLALPTLSVANPGTGTPASPPSTPLPGTLQPGPPVP